MDNIAQIKRRQILKDLIDEWNANRLDLFEISQPDENQEYHGVMRFLFQDAGAKLATKCIRVSSNSCTQDVIGTLVEKFRPDMKMLTTPIYHLYEVDSNSVERKLDDNEYPLEVQLNWTKDEKEGKFVLRNAAHKPINVNKADTNESSFKRKLSKREKKEQKKNKLKMTEFGEEDREEPSGVFVRTKSNSEAVMRRRRELKVQKKLDEIQKEGDQGGLLKVHGDSLNVDVPYKSLLLSVTDTADYVVREMLDKYGLTQDHAGEFCLVQVFNANAGEIGGGLRPQENVLNDDECPLAILQLQVNRGNITFHVRRRDGKRSKEDARTPFLLELNLDGTDMKKPKKHSVHVNMTEVGSIAVPSSGQHLRIIGPTVLPHHAVIANIEGVVTVTPTSDDAECFVEGQRIFETSVLQHGKVVRFGHHHAFRFIDPKMEEGARRLGSLNGSMVAGDSEVAPFSRVDDVLPAGLEFRDEGEDSFLHCVISDVTEGMCTFKLAPCYTLYLASRYRMDRFRQGVTVEEHYHQLTEFCNKTAILIRNVVSRCRGSPQELAFWMANMSEYLHFLKMDRDLQGPCAQAQDILADSIQDAFRDLVYIMQGDLYQSMPAFLTDSDNDADAGEILHVLSSAMSLLRRCRVNAALTIQLFSQLFHFINMWLFNKLVLEPHLGLITRRWGERLKRRLERVEAWAEKQGLELAADCHLCRITQAANLLQAPKHRPEDIASISSSCFKLNSLQLRALLEQYRPDTTEMPHVPQDVIESVVRVAQNTADDLTRSEGREVRLEEDADLQLPFLLPEDGYSSDIVKGIPQGLGDFLEPVMQDGLCRLTPLPTQSGSWQVFITDPEEDLVGIPPPGMHEPLPPPPSPPPPPISDEPDIIDIELHKVKGSMGLSIVAAKGDTQAEKGIYIKSVVDGGAADQDGRLKAGDQLLMVDGKGLLGLTQESAAELMKETGQVVHLKVAKQGAIYHGLATLLNQLTPPMNREAGPPGNMSTSKSTPNMQQPYSGYPPGGFAPPPDERNIRPSGFNMPPPDNRAMSQPNLGGLPAEDTESQNYQNVPTDLRGPPSRPTSQYRPDGGISTPTGSERPRSEWFDPNWNPPPQAGFPRQPIYQNQPINNQKKPGGLPTSSSSSMRSPSGDLADSIPPPVPPHPSMSAPGNNVPDDLPLPPPPHSNYVNFQVNAPTSYQSGPPTTGYQSGPHTSAAYQPNGPASNAGHQPNSPPITSGYSGPPRSSGYQPPGSISSNYKRTESQPLSTQSSIVGGRFEPPRSTGYDPRPVPDRSTPLGGPSGAPNQAGVPTSRSEPPPWARGAATGPRGPTPAPQSRFGSPNAPLGGLVTGPRSPANSLPRGVRPPGALGPGPRPGDLMNASPQIQPYRPPAPDRPMEGLGPRGVPRPNGMVYQRPPPPSMTRPPPPGSFAARPQVPGATRPLGPPTMLPGHNQSQSQLGRQADDRRSQRSDTIRSLESKPYRTGDEEERLARLRLDDQFERKAEQAERDEADNMSRSGSMNRTAGMSPQPFNRGPDQNHSSSSASMKRESSKTVTFKPAYSSDRLRAGEFPKPTLKPATGSINSELPNNSVRNMPNSQPPQADYLRQQREPTRGVPPPGPHPAHSGPGLQAGGPVQPSIPHPGLGGPPAQGGPFSLSTPERDVLRNRLDEELREKQRREGGDQRRSLYQQEEEEMRYRREHDLSQRRESERLQMQQLNDARDDQQRGMDQRQPPPRERRTNGLNDASYNPRNSFGPTPYRAPDSSAYRQSTGDPAHRYSAYGAQPYPAAPSSQAASYSSSAPLRNAYNDMSPTSNNSRSSVETPGSLAFTPGSHTVTPGVIGAQEVYRDPRSRIEAQQRAPTLRSESDRLSFTDKMKLFNNEGNENGAAPKPKASRTQRVLEDQLAFGSGGY